MLRLPILLLLLLSSYSSTLMLSHSAQWGSDSSAAGPRIAFDTLSVDLGRIEPGSSAEHTYLVRNDGDAPLIIKQVRPSCGCTVAVLDDSAVAPQHGTRIHVKFDSHAKGLGAIGKTISVLSNDPVTPEAKLSFHLLIVPPDTIKEHASLKDPMKGAMHLDGIFKGDCAKCHVDKGKGLLGMELWNADCAICHGSPADGKPGPALTSPAMMAHSAKEWMAIVKEGIPKSNMPAFASAASGPLSDNEIASIAEYLAAVKKQINNHQSVGMK